MILVFLNFVAVQALVAVLEPEPGAVWGVIYFYNTALVVAHFYKRLESRTIVLLGAVPLPVPFLLISVPSWRGMISLASLFYYSRVCEVVLDSSFSTMDLLTRIAHVQMSFCDIRDATKGSQGQGSGRRIVIQCLELLPSAIVDGLLAAGCAFMFGTSFFSSSPAARLLTGGIYALVSLNLFGRSLQLIFLIWGGVKLPDLMLRPELSCTMREFWGKRWDTVVQSYLARYVFTPLAEAGVSKPVCVLVTFAASGLLHTYPLFIAGLPLFSALSMLSYFMVQGVLLLLERQVFDVHHWKSSLQQRVWTISCVLLPAPLLLEPVYAMCGI
jgi:hypothetical protein